MAPGLGVDEATGTLGSPTVSSYPGRAAGPSPASTSYRRIDTEDFGVGIGSTLEGPLEDVGNFDPGTSQYHPR